MAAAAVGAAGENVANGVKVDVFHEILNSMDTLLQGQAMMGSACFE
jgi:hypothetical protein